MDELGAMPAGALEGVEQALLRSREFELLFGNDDAKVFVLADGIDIDSVGDP